MPTIYCCALVALMIDNFSLHVKYMANTCCVSFKAIYES